ncbi:MAG: MFS transporter [Candidatus Omnitrophica bacterium]|nr:MFS transporter [Candidatus Omnitrophota bacterium]
MQDKKLDKNIFTLGLVSLFTDISSQMIYPLLPIFLSSVLGVNIAFIGLLEGIAESTASILKLVSGWFSDKLKKRKPIIFFGYSLSTIGKPFLFLATAGWHVLVVRFIDRVGKGIRTSPRDALVADSSLPEQRGRAFGIQRAMDRMGAFLGPLIAFAILPLLNNNLRLVFLLAFFPALIAVVIIVFFLKEKLRIQDPTKQIKYISLKHLGRDFKLFVLVLAIFTLGNSSDAFLILRARDLGVKIVFIPILWLVYNFVSSLSSIPLGDLSDRIGRRKTTLLGFFVYSIVYLGFAFSNTQGLIWIFMALYGVYYGLSEGVLRAYVADLVEDKSVLASAYGIYHTVVGLCMFPASLIMGILWQQFSPTVAFGFGAFLALISAAALSIFIRK